MPQQPLCHHRHVAVLLLRGAYHLPSHLGQIRGRPSQNLPVEVFLNLRPAAGSTTSGRSHLRSPFSAPADRAGSYRHRPSTRRSSPRSAHWRLRWHRPQRLDPQQVHHPLVVLLRGRLDGQLFRGGRAAGACAAPGVALRRQPQSSRPPSSNHTSQSRKATSATSATRHSKPRSRRISATELRSGPSISSRSRLSKSRRHVASKAPRIHTPSARKDTQAQPHCADTANESLQKGSSACSGYAISRSPASSSSPSASFALSALCWESTRSRVPQHPDQMR